MTGPTPNQKLHFERERRAWSQQEVADKVGTTPLNVSRWERGITHPSPYFRQRLCEVFEKSAQELGLVPESVQDGKPAETSPQDAIHLAPTAPVTPSTQETAASLWNVPYNRNLFFTGREDILTQLHTSLNSEEGPIALAQPQAISGLGGIGKTQTAVEYAYRYRDHYDAVLWARADSPELLISDFLLIAALLNLPQRNEQDQSVVVKAVLRWFDTHERWLLILDNADHLEIIKEFIPAGKGHVLLTTRAHSTGTIAQRIEIEKMDLDEGTAFLLRRIKYLKGNTGLETIPESVRSQAQAIVEAVDGLPLALDQAGAYIEETGCSLVDYLKFFKTRRNRLLRMRGRDAAGHPEPVATTWSLSFEKVEYANSAAADLLRLCAFLHPDEIPESMIIEGASELGPLLESVAEDELDWNEAIGELRKYSLVKRDPESKILNMHRLVQGVLKDAMDKELQREWAERTVRIVNKVFPEVEFSIWPKCQQYLPHAQICTYLVHECELFCSEAAQLLNRVGNYLRERAQYKEAEPLLQQSLAMHERIVGPEHPGVAKSLNDLGLLYRNQGKYEQAEPLYQRALAIRKRELGPHHIDVAQTLNNLAKLYNDQGQYKRAELLFQRALTICEQELGVEHPDIAPILDNFAGLYYDQAEYGQAESFYRRALIIREQNFGPGHPDVAQTLNNLGVLYWQQGKYEQAEPLYQRGLSIYDQVFGPHHPRVADNLNNLGVLYHHQGRYEQAEQLLQQAIIIFERVFGSLHPDLANTLNELAIVYRECGRYEDSEPLFLRALSIREQILGPNHPELAKSLNNLATLYRYQGKYAEAEPLYQRAITLRERALGPMHPLVAASLENYAKLLHQTNREAEAATLEARASAIRKKQE